MTKARWLALLALALGTGAAVTANGQDANWELKAACGINLTRGNSDTTAGNLEISADSKGAKNECHLGGLYAYGETDDETTEENSRLDGQYNRLLTDRIYLYLNGKAERDEIAMLDYRLLAGPGAGFYALKSDAHKLKIEAGVSYLEEKLTYTETIDDVETETEKKEDTTTFRLLERYDGKLGKAKVWQSIEYLPETDDTGSYLLTAEIGLETLVTDVLSLRLAATDKYDSEPAPGSDKNDMTVRVSLVFSLSK